MERRSVGAAIGMLLPILASIAVLFADVAAAQTVSYALKSKQALDFGGRIDTAYILDVFDLDRDGADDFAVSAKAHVVDYNKPEKNKFIRSFLVLSRPDAGKAETVDLGEGGLTQRTWSGRFFTVPGSESTFFILGRNGEVGLPHTLVGEHQSLFEIRRGPSGIAVDKVFEEAERGTASSVDACDIDRDGSVEIYINNNGGPQSTDILQVHIVSVGAGKIVERYAATFLGGMDRHGSYNDVRFADADGDGDCDLLTAIEVEKADETSSANANDRIQSYVILNRIGGFDGVRLDLPNPYFGKNNAAFSIEAAAVNGERLVALDSSEFRGHTTGFRKFAFQLFALRDGAYVEVTKDLVSGRIDNDEANQSNVRFADIDGDGDLDIYFTRYSAAVQVYVNDGTKFVRRVLRVKLAAGQKSVAFLRTPGRSCLDMAVVDSNARLYRFQCAVK